MTKRLVDVLISIGINNGTLRLWKLLLDNKWVNRTTIRKKTGVHYTKISNDLDKLFEAGIVKRIQYNWTGGYHGKSERSSFKYKINMDHPLSKLMNKTI